MFWCIVAEQTGDGSDASGRMRKGWVSKVLASELSSGNMRGPCTNECSQIHTRSGGLTPESLSFEEFCSWRDESRRPRYRPTIKAAHWTAPQVAHSASHSSGTSGTISILYREVELPVLRLLCTPQSGKHELDLRAEVAPCAPLTEYLDVTRYLPRDEWECPAFHPSPIITHANNSRKKSARSCRMA